MAYRSQKNSWGNYENNSIYHYLYNHLASKIERVDGKADRVRTYYYLARIILIVVGAAVTLISGWNGEEVKASRCALNALLGLGVITSTITAFDALFQVETKKNTYRLMVVEIREIRSEFVYLHDNKTPDIDNIVKDKLFPKFQSVMAYAKSLLDNDN